VTAGADGWAAASTATSGVVVAAASGTAAASVATAAALGTTEGSFGRQERDGRGTRTHGNTGCQHPKLAGSAKFCNVC
jgi:hypothetical protein